MRPHAFLLGILLAFASLETILGILKTSSAIQTPAPLVGPNVASNPLFAYSVPFAVTGWIALGLVFYQGGASSRARRSQVRNLFASRGFDADIYDLMMGMRGGSSRVSLLENLESPKHRQELSELTGSDWKEVDRQVAVLERYGLVKVSAQSGTVKLYQLTESGRLLIKLISELGGTEPHGSSFST